MRVLFDHPSPFRLAHGGFQIQIEQTRAALKELGVEVDWLRWWDDGQSGDVIHFFGRPSHWYVGAAQQKGMKVVSSELLTGLGSRGAFARGIQAAVIRALRDRFFFERMSWNAFRMVDAAVAPTEWEAHLMRTVFGAPAERVHVVPNGVEPAFFRAPPVERGPWLVCTATIAGRKRVCELCDAAILARTPVWIVGKPYAADDSYFARFQRLARSAPELIRYESDVSDRDALAAIYRQARGFVLLSTMESLSLSALEAAACECPLLLSDLPWARSTFGAAAAYCPIGGPSATAPVLRQFYDEAPTRPTAPKPRRWPEIASDLRAVYARVLGG